MEIGSLFTTAVEGIRRQLERMNGAANQVLIESTEPSTPDRVHLSGGAPPAAASDSAETSGIEGALVDLRVSKYLAVANMKVLETGEDTTKELLSIVGRR
jgi:hypothetical protein